MIVGQPPFALLIGALAAAATVLGRMLAARYVSRANDCSSRGEDAKLASAGTTVPSLAFIYLVVRLATLKEAGA